MVASLDEFRRQFPPLASISEIQNYLKRELSASDVTDGNVKRKLAATVNMRR